MVFAASGATAACAPVLASSGHVLVAAVASAARLTPMIRFIMSSCVQRDRRVRCEIAMQREDGRNPYLPLKTSAHTAPIFRANFAAAALVTTGLPPEIV